jgi:hypothetical protein
MGSKEAEIRLICLMLLLGLGGSARAGWEAGIGLDLSRDLSDAGSTLADATMGTGGVLRAPVRRRLGPQIALRADIGLGLARGQDRVEWLAYEGLVPMVSTDHGTTATTLSTGLGPELSPFPEAVVSPYLGTQVGVLWAAHWHRFDPRSAELMGLADPEGGRHPYTTQFAPMVELHGGGRMELSGGLAIELEAGYNVAFLRQARLSQAPAALEAVRTAYGLNQLRLGLNLVIPLHTGSES